MKLDSPAALSRCGLTLCRVEVLRPTLVSSCDSLYDGLVTAYLASSAPVNSVPRHVRQNTMALAVGSFSFLVSRSCTR